MAHFSNFLRVTGTKRLQLIFLSIFSWLSGCTFACKSIYKKSHTHDQCTSDRWHP